MKNFICLVSVLILFGCSTFEKEPQLNHFGEMVKIAVANSEMKIRVCSDYMALDKYWLKQVARIDFLSEEKGISDICEMAIPFIIPVIFKEEVDAGCEKSRQEIGASAFSKLICEKLKELEAQK